MQMIEETAQLVKASLYDRNYQAMLEEAKQSVGLAMEPLFLVEKTGLAREKQ